MKEALPLAEKMLREHGGFYPYGAALDRNGKVVPVSASDGKARPAPADLIRLLAAGFEEGAKKGKYQATALIYDARVLDPSSGVKSDAIAVALDHRENYSVVVYIPYRVESGKYFPGKLFATKGESRVFK
ncbi:hypothetical protein [Caenimonas soli]|uniref:hypothetical protein n=1 Tax=Caenimonas soli TaxID=2735555 RepID=UPI00155662EF|nr:hypothetical protein [Caenimonas soli]NPC59398.1 hypothetical protein [Caenimonas soli]